jgi:SAM-dependent methyltransferase
MSALKLRSSHVNLHRAPASGPDRGAALAQYRRRAAVYDLELALFEPVRRQAVASLGLRRGDVVLDVGCGTGLSLPLLRAAVGPRGRVIGIEQSPEMIAKARQRVARQRWKNVTLLCASVELAEIPGRADAALFHFTHDILRRPEAVALVLHHLRPGASVVAAGLKWASAWAWPTNALVLAAALRSTTSLRGLHQPWSLLAAGLEGLELRSLMLGAVYLAHGRALRQAGAAAA